MEINLLGAEEVKYELAIRGMPTTGSFPHKRAALREAMRSEREGGSGVPNSSCFDTDSELCICQGKLAMLSRDISNFDSENGEGEYRRISTLLTHTEARLKRLLCVLASERETQQDFLEQCTDLFNRLVMARNATVPREQPPSAPYTQTVTQSNQSLLDTDNPAPGQSDAIPGRTAPISNRVSRDVAVSNDLIVLSENDDQNSDSSTSSVQPVPTRNISGPPKSAQRIPKRRFLPAPRNPIVTVSNAPGDCEEQARISWSREAARSTNNLPVTSWSRPWASNNLPRFSSRPQSTNLNIPSSYQQFLGEPPLQQRQSSSYGQQPLSSMPQSSVNNPPFGHNRGTPGHANCPPWTSGRPAQVHFEDAYPDFSRQVHLDSTRPNETLSHSNPYVDLGEKLDNFQFSPLRGRESNRSFLTPPYNKLQNVSSWGITYNGQTSVTDFLERIEELRVSRNVPKENLLRSAPELFTRDALLWFRTGCFASWDDVVVKLRDAFQPYDYEYGLWDEIHRRTQGSQERVIGFVVAMEALFRKLPTLPLESSRLQVIRRNLLPHIQRRLSTERVETLQDLLRLSRFIEETEARVQRFAPPPTNYRTLLEPSLAYHKPASYVALINESQELPAPSESYDCQDGTPDLAAINTSSTCWNCLAPGHNFRQCPDPRKRFCFRCGHRDVISKDCPKCSKNDMPGRSN